jgi:uncharacterized membrane protein
MIGVEITINEAAGVMIARQRQENRDRCVNDSDFSKLAGQ